MEICPWCGRRDRQVKAGFSGPNQRFRCLACGRRYTPAIGARYPYAQELTPTAQPESQTAGTAPHRGPTPSVNARPQAKPAGRADRSQLRRRPTIADVAARAGISISTVSNYLNGKGRMSPATNTRIENAIADLNFSPNFHVRAIRDRRTRILGVVTFGLGLKDDQIQVAVSPPILYGIDQAADENAHELLMYTGWASHPERYSDMSFLNGHVDGLIWVAPQLHEPLLERVVKAGLPTVSILTRHVPEGGGYVNAENVESVRSVVGYLHGLGHRRIAYMGAGHSSNYADRHHGYLLGLEDAGLARDLALEDVPTVDMWNKLSREKALRQWLTLSSRPTAFLCADDGYAFWVIDELKKQGIRVPEDASVVGFNDVPLASTFAGGMTTIRQPLRAIGEAGVRRLIALIEGADPESCQITIPANLIVRNTTGPAP